MELALKDTTSKSWITYTAETSVISDNALNGPIKILFEMNNSTHITMNIDV